MLLAQPIPNPNNKPAQALNGIELQTLPSYAILTIPIHEIQLRYGRVVNDRPKSSVIIREENEEEDPDEVMNDAILQDVPNIPVHTHTQQEPTQEQIIPPFLEQLAIEKPVIHPEYDILNELKNVCVKMPLLQAIKDIPIYSNLIKELCIKKPGKKQKCPLTIHVIGEMSECMIDQSRIEKYANPRSPVVTVILNNISIENTHIYLGFSTNMMTNAILEF